MINIPQTDPYANYLSHKDQIDNAILRVLDSGTYIMGNEVSSFEEEFAKFIGCDFVAGVASGTDAIDLALRSLGIGVGSVVFTVSHTAVATVAAIERTGATPILVDIAPDTYNMDVVCLENAIKAYSDESAAIVPVHLYGHPADMESIMRIADDYGLFVVEDCAQAHGASILNKKVGTWGHLSAFSFYPTKNLGALGDAGAVASNDLHLIEKVRHLQEYGWTKRYISEMPGINSRMDPIQAAVLRIKLTRLDEENKKRNISAEIYNDAFSILNIQLPYVKNDVSHVFHQYVVRVEHRDELREFLYERGISTGIHYPLPVHQQPAYNGRIVIHDHLKHTETISSNILSLPMYSELSSVDVDMVIREIMRWYDSKLRYF